MDRLAVPQRRRGHLVRLTNHNSCPVQCGRVEVYVTTRARLDLHKEEKMVLARDGARQVVYNCD